MAQHADGERQPERVCDRRQSPFAQVVRHLVHDYRLVRELMRCPAAGAPRSWSEALAFEPTVRHGVAERSRATWEGIARDRADGGPVRLLGTDERGDQPAAETTALGRPWSPVVQVTELSQVNLGASLGYQHCCVSITIGWSSLSRPPICPGWSSLSRPPSCPGWSSLSRPPSCPGWPSLSRPPICPGWSSLSRPPPCPGWSSPSRPPPCPGWSSPSRPPSCPGWSSLSRPPSFPGWSSLSRPPSCPGWSSLSRPPSCPGWSSLSRPPPCKAFAL